MKIVFMGSPDFALPSLQKLYQSSHEIVAVVSGKDKRRGRGGDTSPTSVKARALKLDLPVIEVENLRSPQFENQLSDLNADLYVVVAFRILPKNILALPARGSVNLHASLLPKYRGAAPIHHAIMNGETETGCTVFMLDETVDTGQIIKQKATIIGENETTGDVYDRLKKMGSDILVQAVNDVGENKHELRAQDHSKATPAPKLYTEDCKVSFNQRALEVHNKIRGLSPFPTAWAKLDDLKFNFYRSRVGPEKDLNPGVLTMEGDQLLAGCAGKKTVILEKVQLQGKRKMSGKDFMNGYSGTGMVH